MSIEWTHGVGERMTAADRLTSDAHALRAAETALANAKRDARNTAYLAASQGVSESEIARRLGVTRQTVRAWIGK